MSIIINSDTIEYLCFALPAEWLQHSALLKALMAND